MKTVLEDFKRNWFESNKTRMDEQGQKHLNMSEKKTIGGEN